MYDEMTHINELQDHIVLELEFKIDRNILLSPALWTWTIWWLRRFYKMLSEMSSAMEWFMLLNTLRTNSTWISFEAKWNNDFGS